MWTNMNLLARSGRVAKPAVISLIGTISWLLTVSGASGALPDTQHFSAENLLQSTVEVLKASSDFRGKLPTMTDLPDGSSGCPGVWLPVTVKSSGAYKLCFKYAQLKNAHDNVQYRIYRLSDKETIRFGFIDYTSEYPGVPSRPYEDMTAPSKAKWAVIPVNFEMPGGYMVEITGCYGVRGKGRVQWGGRAAAPVVSDVWLSNVPSFSPLKPTAETEALISKPTAEGFILATSHPVSAKLNSALPAHDRLQLCLHECYSYYQDFANSVNLGVNMNLQGQNALRNFDEKDTPITKGCSFGSGKDFAKKYPGNIGKSANYRGEYSHSYSYSFKPYREACYQSAVESVKRIVASEENRAILNWYSAWEQCGNYDYGETSVNAFRNEYLPAKYGSLENLNKAWHTDYKSFDEIVPANHDDCVGKNKKTDGLELARAKASFIDFRDFNSKAYATWLGLKSKAIRENDPEHRNMSSAYSNNNLGSICWLRWRPVSFEDSMQYTLKGSGTMGWDIYGTDDLVATAFEHWYSFSDDQTIPMIKEGNIHAIGNELTVRTFYNLFGEGMRGMAFFTVQESPKPELRKFGMSNPDDDMAPRPKLAAVSDCFRALQHIEPFFAYARRRPVGKPVAIYYSQTCNVLQERGYGSMFDCAPDSHMRVFEIIRSCGYPCTIITERQILEGKKLDEISAIFFVDAQYINDAVVDKLDKWIRKGGHIVADGQTGCYDDHGFPSRKMLNLLGIEPIKRKRISEAAAENLAFGYSSQAFEAVNPDELWLTMREYLHQRDTQHPVAKAAGKIMISAFGAQNVKSLDGENIILGNNGEVGWNIRPIGKGSASYFAGYLGTIFGSGCTQYEWRDAHSDQSPYIFFDALLDYFGAKKNAATDLEEHIHVRYGSPLVDSEGNMISVFTNFSDHELRPFHARVFLPKGVKPPKLLLFTKERSREITQLDFTYDKSLHAINCQVPAFRVFGNLLLIQNQKYPLVSVMAESGEATDSYGLPDFRPGQAMTFKVKVFNTTPGKLKGGQLTLRLPDGWFYDRESVEVPVVKAFESSEEYAFTVRAPEVCAARRLRPVNFVFDNGKATSTPAVDMVWFQQDKQEDKGRLR